MSKRSNLIHKENHIEQLCIACLSEIGIHFPTHLTCKIISKNTLTCDFPPKKPEL